MDVTRRRYPFYFALPAVVLYATFFVVPSLVGFAYAFTDWSSYSDQINFVGWQNFATIFSPNERYLTYIWNTLVFTAVTVVLKTVIALALALLLNEGVKRLRNFYRVVIFLPAVLPVLIVALIFRSILNPATGFLNSFLRDIGLSALALPWLIDPHIALYSVIGVDTWRGVGYLMVILLAGLQTIPKEYHEAAQIDGASAWQRLWLITLPLLTPAMVVVSVLNVLYGLRVFDIVYVMTHGGPGYATEVLATEIFRAFSQGQWGLGTAVNTIMFILLLFAGFFVIRLLDRNRATE